MISTTAPQKFTARKLPTSLEFKEEMDVEMDVDLSFQRLLLRVQESLSAVELQDLLFLCSDIICLRDLSTVSLGQELFSLLQKQDLLSSSDPSLLVELLRIIKQTRLIRSLHLDAYVQTNGSADQPLQQRISPYRQFLYELSESTNDKDLKNIKFLLIKTLSRRKLDMDITLLQLFLEMEKEDLLGENNLDALQTIIADINPSLERKIIQYKEENCGQFIEQETEEMSSELCPPALPSPLTSVSVDLMEGQVDGLSLSAVASGFSEDQSQDFNSGISSERSEMPQTEIPLVEHYVMRGERRGICLILNNYDFSKCGLLNREGTDIDQESLEEVFQWLGFEVLSRRDCGGEEMLELLRNLAARDHTQADCFVCCVLSHGRINGVLGVDGILVTFNELIETLSPQQCSSLYQKPKLFFIQACRGNKEQRPAYPPMFSKDEEGPVSDAAVPRDSIPEMADYLLAMSTVPHYVSFREKEKGTWFIQSLCHNLRQLVPRGKDLLSILTKVNADVSRKSDKSGLRKQMPQPEFTLTKTVVFPPPALQ